MIQKDSFLNTKNKIYLTIFIILSLVFFQSLAFQAKVGAEEFEDQEYLINDFADAYKVETSLSAENNFSLPENVVEVEHAIGNPEEANPNDDFDYETMEEQVAFSPFEHLAAAQTRQQKDENCKNSISCSFRKSVRLLSVLGESGINSVRGFGFVPNNVKYRNQLVDQWIDGSLRSDDYKILVGQYDELINNDLNYAEQGLFGLPKHYNNAADAWQNKDETLINKLKATFNYVWRLGVVSTVGALAVLSLSKLAVFAVKKLGAKVILMSQTALASLLKLARKFNKKDGLGFLAIETYLETKAECKREGCQDLLERAITYFYNFRQGYAPRIDVDDTARLFKREVIKDIKKFFDKKK